VDENIAAQRQPFKLDGWPLDALDQTAMVELRKLAEQTGWTVAEVMHEVTQEYVARRQAENDLPAKILKFPKRQVSRIAGSSSRNAVGFSSACTRGPASRSFVFTEQLQHEWDRR
jgi:hypothetical protein